MSGANTEQIQFWNDLSGPTWARRQAELDAQIRAIGEKALARLAPASGEAVLDVGCGCGDTSLALLPRVAPGGTVLGVDVSRPMLARARERLAEAGLTGVTFAEADAQTHAFEPGAFDAVFSRFGVMFFADAVAAFANLRRALRPGGRLAFVCWQGIDRNEWVRVPIGAAARHVPLPEPPAPGAPGPFSLADPERVRALLGAAGYTDIAVEAHETTVAQAGGRGLDDVVAFLLEVGPVAGLLRQEPEARPAVEEALREAVAPYAGPEGLRMGAAVWLVTAASPA